MSELIELSLLFAPIFYKCGRFTTSLHLFSIWLKYLKQDVTTTDWVTQRASPKKKDKNTQHLFKELSLLFPTMRLRSEFLWLSDDNGIEGEQLFNFFPLFFLKNTSLCGLFYPLRGVNCIQDELHRSAEFAAKKAGKMTFT